ncbi:chemotaxis protein CheD [Wenzhouxiangella sp. AB-CW3]|uniref:chemotaxis protein CheD n=1 Tax=Wenzhouxiangella sp. AB-CW3 TaxID=2771012 RepID=UPI00168B34BA|nr:chemotaxis protein CheD [Wenzhouxiangella sp. AB-CW3]QOC21175.1 chemotaxis protein CheD [Wenzhouxiangella sp. AB-CW3]
MKSLLSDPQITVVNLAPGELHFGDGRTVITTLLGSCVAITLWHPQRKLGGMCHYLLTDRSQYTRSAHYAPGYYATDAIEFFLKTIRKNGCRPDDFEVKLFGGGNMFENIKVHGNPINVAQVNADEGRRMLNENGFQVKAADVGGVRYRKIYFELASGDVWVQYGRHSHNTFQEETR